MEEASQPAGAKVEPKLAPPKGRAKTRGGDEPMAPFLIGIARPGPIAIIVLAIGLAVTLFAWRAVAVRETRIVSERFEHVATQLLSEMGRHQGVHEQTLRAGAGLLSVVGIVDAAQWRAIYDALRVSEVLPGVQGYGFAEAVPAQSLAAHTERLRTQGFPKYAVSPPGERSFYTPIAHLEPFDWRNQRAHGFDMFSDPERRAAMMRAAENGSTAATGQVRLVQETEADVQPGFLLYVPVYRRDRVRPPEREQFPGLMGFVYSPVRINDFFATILEAFEPNLQRIAAIQVFDGPRPVEDALIFSTGEMGKALGEFAIERPHNLFGRTWVVRMAPLPAFLQTTDQRVRAEMLVGGLALSFMAAALAWLIAQRQRQREEAAQRNDMIAREMSHRVKNLLAVIQAIASRTMSGGRTIEEAKSVFADRLSALARAHTALVDGRWSGALLRNLLEGELAPFGARVSISGPVVRLNTQMAQNMAMAVHELATNAVKYGALSEGAGVVRIAWSVRESASGPVFSFSWVERGGPPASEPERVGFGQTLLRRLIGASIGADPVTEYSEVGFSYRFECPLERIVGPPAAE